MLFENNDRIVFAGDSVTDMGSVNPVGEGLFDNLGHGYVRMFENLLTALYPQMNIRITNSGISGNTSRDLLMRYERDVVSLKPDWVSTLIGINDVWRQFDSPTMPETHVSPEDFEATYTRLIERTLPHVQGMILMTPYFMEPNRQDSMRVRMDEYGAIVRHLAQRYHLTCVDLQEGWDRLFAHMHPCSIAWDRIHPNQTGCMYIAKQFLKAVGADRC